jgi:hypothetical protein
MPRGCNPRGDLVEGGDGIAMSPLLVKHAKLTIQVPAEFLVLLYLLVKALMHL